MPATCMPPLCANAQRPTYAACASGWRLQISAASCEIWLSRAEPLRADAGVAELELEARDDRDQVGVAAALAVAVHRALHEARAGLDGGERVRDGALGVVVRVDAERDARRRAPRATSATAAATCAGSVAPLVSHIVTFAAPASAAVWQAAQRVVAVGRVAVEEVLGVVDDLLALLDAEPHRVADHREVLLARDAHDLVEVQVPGLADERDHRREAVDQHAQRLVVGGAHVLAARHAERRDARGRGTTRARAARTAPSPSGSRPGSRPRCSRSRAGRAGVRPAASRPPTARCPPAACRRAAWCRRCEPARSSTRRLLRRWRRSGSPVRHGGRRGRPVAHRRRLR